MSKAKMLEIAQNIWNIKVDMMKLSIMLAMSASTSSDFRLSATELDEIALMTGSLSDFIRNHRGMRPLADYIK